MKERGIRLHYIFIRLDPYQNNFRPILPGMLANPVIAGKKRVNISSSLTFQIPIWLFTECKGSVSRVAVAKLPCERVLELYRYENFIMLLYIHIHGAGI